MIGMQKKIQQAKNKVARGRIYRKVARCGTEVWTRQLKKSDIRSSKKEENIYIDSCKLMPNDIINKRNLKRRNLITRDKFQVLNFIFDTVMKRVLENMVEDKNIYVFPSNVELIIGTIDNDKKRFSFFTYDTSKTINVAIHNSEFHGYAWTIYTSREINKKLEHYTNVRKENYIKCKTLLGRQSQASYRGKLSLLTSKLRKKGLSLSSLRRL